MSKEGITQQGVGVGYKKNVTVRSDKIAGGGDAASVPSGTQQAFNKACKDTKKA